MKSHKRFKKICFQSSFLKMSKDELDRMAKGKLFHKNGTEREKAQSPSVVHFAQLARIGGLEHRNKVKISD